MVFVHSILIIAIAFMAGLSLPAEQPISDTIIYKNEIYKRVPVVAAEVKKAPFKDRHPRIYKCYRAGRKVCLVAKPFLDVAAAAAQIATPFAAGR